MKKKITILVCIIFVLAAATTYAAVQMTQTSISTKSNFDTMIEVMEETCTDEEYNSLLLNYMFFEKGYNLSDNQMDYIAQLVVNGYNMREVLECAYFWIDTNESISIIEEMCKIKSSTEKYDNIDTWAEEIFNLITKEKCGVLTAEEIIEYQKCGLTTDEILAANVLCRKGVYSIHEILDKMQQGKKIAEIAAEVDAATDSAHSKAIAQNQTHYSINIQNSEDASDVISYRQLQRLGGETVNAVLTEETSDKTADILLAEKEDEIIDDILKEMKSKNLYKRPKKTSGLIDEIKQHQIEDGKLEKLLENYSEMDILNAVNISEVSGQDVEELLKKNASGINWNEIAGGIAR